MPDEVTIRIVGTWILVLFLHLTLSCVTNSRCNALQVDNQRDLA